MTGAELLVETIAALQAGTLRSTPQPEEGVSLAPLLSKEDGRIDWTRDAVDLARLVRGVSPWPGAWCVFRDAPLKVHAAEVLDVEAAQPAGCVTAVGDEGVDVRCGRGSLRLTRLQPAGRKALHAAEFLRGYRLEPGESLAAS